MAPVEGLEKELGLARRNVFLLAAAQAILGSAPPITFAMGGLAAYQMLGDDKSLATAPLTGFNIGVSIGTIVVAILSRYLARKLSFIIGALLTAFGGLIAAVAIFQSNFWLMVAGLALTGVSGGFTQKFRFAAADASPSFYKGSAISWILAGGIVSAVAGPQIAIATKELFEPVLFAGAFVAFAPMGLLAAGILVFLKLPPVHDKNAPNAETARPLSGIVLKPRFLTGMFCGVSSYALMTFMMTGAPLAMVVGCGYSTDDSTLGIQFHVLAMFGPSFVTGALIKRFGAEKIVACGLVILMLCAAIAHTGIELWNFWGALVLLGFGWNFGFIGSTAIVASSYRPSEADKVQAYHDIILFTMVALSSFASGQIFTRYGWDAMILPVWPLALTGLALLAIQGRAGRVALSAKD
ncbi:putative MFS family arabinose efflux permease [Rhizobium sp. SG_E_25_P2]|jgi:predicted MFS family arabinose efflux permease|uniref:MFS transporter n=1 Tax=Rhizobium sp. SG_E_25_P2 TaxID=2879942 RepID=UPI0024769043|nr:MFS transporter [Rhizobium sp. SG_E_25_P2]MDH6266710.1 putative MFS family arabinose efflux permease [Rhizobium sp. SG_E_25_P2]